MATTHQPDQAEFRSTLPEDIDWEPFPSFPPTARLAVVVGHPSEPGPYVVRVKVPSGVKLMPHRHHEDRVYTVMSGVFYIGLGDVLTGFRPVEVRGATGEHDDGSGRVRLQLGFVELVAKTNVEDA